MCEGAGFFSSRAPPRLKSVFFRRLNDELLVLRMENMHLTQRISSMPTYGLPITYPVPDEMAALPLVAQQGTFNPSKPQQDLPFVEFDMRRTPPTVQSANVMFCSLLGYTTEEVLGKPWQYFIQDDYVERTVRMLQRDAGAKQMRFGQVYKVRPSSVFFRCVARLQRPLLVGSPRAASAVPGFAHVQPR